MELHGSEAILIAAGYAGYLEYEDIKGLFNSSSNRNRVITKLKDKKYIEVVSRDGLRTIRLLPKGKEYVSLKYPYVELAGKLSTRLESKKRRCLIGGTILDFMKAGIPVGTKEEGNPEGPVYYPGKKKKEGVSTMSDRPGRNVGVLETKDMVFSVYRTGDYAVKWEDHRENSQLNRIHAEAEEAGKGVGTLIIGEAVNPLGEIVEASLIPERVRRAKVTNGVMRMYLAEKLGETYYLKVARNDKEDIRYMGAQLELLSDRAMKTRFETELRRLVRANGGECVCHVPVNMKELLLDYLGERNPDADIVVCEPYAAYLKAFLNDELPDEGKEDEKEAREVAEMEVGESEARNAERDVAHARQKGQPGDKERFIRPVSIDVLEKWIADQKSR